MNEREMFDRFRKVAVEVIDEANAVSNNIYNTLKNEGIPSGISNYLANAVKCLQELQKVRDVLNDSELYEELNVRLEELVLNYLHCAYTWLDISHAVLWRAKDGKAVDVVDEVVKHYFTVDKLIVKYVNALNVAEEDEGE